MLCYLPLFHEPTDAFENITFLQLPLRAVTNNLTFHSKIQEVTGCRSSGKMIKWQQRKIQLKDRAET